MDREDLSGRIRALLQQGAPWAASDAFLSARANGDRGDAELLYWGALAHARSGARTQARRLLDDLLTRFDVLPETRREGLCLSGRLWKDEAIRTHAAGRDATGALGRARDEYVAAHGIDGATYPAANAATLSLLLGDAATAHALATQVLRELPPSSGSSDPWNDATRGEALLLLGAVDDARRAYRAVAERMAHDLGGVAAMRRQLTLIGWLIGDALEIRDSLPSPTVVGFIGHMIDRADRSEARFPAAIEPAVAAALRDRIKHWTRAIVYSSPACGADILFLEAALEAGAEVNIVLPFDREDFLRTSVAFAGGQWVGRFDRVLADAAQVIQATTEGHLGDDLLFKHARHLVAGLTMLRADQLEIEPTMLFAIDVDSAQLVGGTRDAFESWTLQRSRVEVVDIGALRRLAPPAAATHRTFEEAVPALDVTDRPKRTLKALLFADMVGFSRVHDVHAPFFHRRFLSIVADRITASANRPLAANTWGDGLYLVFAHASEAAAFAVGLVEDVRDGDWTNAGLPDSSGIRVALHAGPVFCGPDPILGRDTYFGTSVTTTARIEPIVPPNVVYASEVFAATLTVEQAPGFVCEYVGEVALAKQFGKTRVFRIDRT